MQTDLPTHSNAVGFDRALPRLFRPVQAQLSPRFCQPQDLSLKSNEKR